MGLSPDCLHTHWLGTGVYCQLLTKWSFPHYRCVLSSIRQVGPALSLAEDVATGSGIWTTARDAVIIRIDGAPVCVITALKPAGCQPPSGSCNKIMRKVIRKRRLHRWRRERIICNFIAIVQNQKAVGLHVGLYTYPKENRISI